MNKPLKALNAWASLELDVTRYVSTKDFIYGAKKERFPPHCATAELTSESGSVTIVENENANAYAVTGGSTYLELTAQGRLPVEVKFTRLRLKATCPMTAAAIKWHNNRL